MEAKQGHAVMVPFPLQGHINPMLQLAKLLHHRGFHITFVNTHFNHKRLLRSGGPDAVAGLPSFRFEAIPDGLPPVEDVEANQDLPSLCQAMSLHCDPHFRHLLARLDASGDVPKVTCVVADAITTFTINPAKDFNLPILLFWTGNVAGFLAFAHYTRLLQMGILPPKDDTNGYLDTSIDWIGGLKGMRVKDLPSFMLSTDTNDITIASFVETEVENARNASAIIVNSFDELDHEPLQALSLSFPPIYTVGPLHSLLKHVPHNNSLHHIHSSLWKLDLDCLNWLNSKPPNSVLYVNFGSATVLTPAQLSELAWGLANSMHYFLWIIRPNLVVGESAILPPEFSEATRDRGFLASWCPQEEVLRHEAVGGFLTHSGWNSTLESVSSGVPMICWPFYSEQLTTCWCCCEKWGIGMEMSKGEVERGKVERLVVELMEKEKGKEMTDKAMEWKRLAEEAASPDNGSSHLNMDKVIDQVLNSKPSR